MDVKELGNAGAVPVRAVLPMFKYPGMLFWVADCSKGEVCPSIPSVLASLPLLCSKKIPYPPRIAVLPLPNGSQAKPTRGAGLNKCPDEHPAGTPPTPHCTRPSKGFPMTAPEIAVTSAPAVPV